MSTAALPPDVFGNLLYRELESSVQWINVTESEALVLSV